MDFLATHMARLTADMLSGIDSHLPNARTFTLSTATFSARDLEPKGKRQGEGEPVYHDPTENKASFWSFRWHDLPPKLIAFDKALVLIEESRAEEVWFPLLVQGRAVDDSGYDMEIRLGSEIARDNMGFYEVRWYNPIMEGGRIYGFVILPRNGQSPVYATSFRFL